MTKKETELVLSWYLVIIGFALGVMVAVGIDYYGKQTFDVPEEPCFYDWDVSYQCDKQGGSLIPVIDDDELLWSCVVDGGLSWLVPAC